MGLTVDGGGVAPDPLNTFWMQGPSSDWDYMMDHTKRELVLDLSIAFHPSSTADQDESWKCSIAFSPSPDPSLHCSLRFAFPQSPVFGPQILDQTESCLRLTPVTGNLGLTCKRRDKGFLGEPSPLRAGVPPSGFTVLGNVEHLAELHWIP